MTSLNRLLSLCCNIYACVINLKQTIQDTSHNSATSIQDYELNEGNLSCIQIGSTRSHAIQNQHEPIVSCYDSSFSLNFPYFYPFEGNDIDIEKNSDKISYITINYSFNISYEIFICIFTTLSLNLSKYSA